MKKKIAPLDIGPAWFVVCKKSAEFTLEQAAVIRRHFYRSVGNCGWNFFCLTDVPTEKWHLPLEFNLPGWWSILEAFKYKGPHILTGLDSLIVDDVTPLLRLAERCTDNELWGIQDFFKPSKWASGVTIWNGDWSNLLFKHACEHRVSFRGNQEFTRWFVTRRMPGRKLKYVNLAIDGIVSYKRDIRGRSANLPGGTRICCFHGNPRPWDIRDAWIRPWLDASLPIFREPKLPGEKPSATFDGFDWMFSNYLHMTAPPPDGWYDHLNAIRVPEFGSARSLENLADLLISSKRSLGLNVLPKTIEEILLQNRLCKRYPELCRDKAFHDGKFT